MARLTDLGVGRVDVPKLDPRDVIIREGFNYRETSSEAAKKHIAWLVESIRERGVDTPIQVEFIDGKVYVVDGECRLRALQQLWEEGGEIRVPAIQFRGDEAATLAKSMVSNGGLPPTQLEFGKAAERLIAYGWHPEKIATLTPPHLGLTGHKAERYVREAVELQQAPLAVKEAVAKGIDGVEVTPALALQATRTSRTRAPQIIAEQVEQAKAAGKSVASRPKTAGVATMAKQADEKQIAKERELGDEMARLILADETDWDTMQAAARKWQKARK